MVSEGESHHITGRPAGSGSREIGRSQGLPSDSPSPSRQGLLCCLPSPKLAALQGRKKALTAAAHSPPAKGMAVLAVRC